MNKQEVLEAVLVRVRRYEEHVSEEPLVTPEDAAERLRVLCLLVSTRDRGTLVGNTELLEQMAALCVHLLRTEWEPAEGRALEDWLREKTA